ncbi:MAG: ORF6N domain-containing protein [Ignavibacteriales bacterium]|nr:ORF6N domain-containing protein [Ignavibacteriales bacterium]
MSKPNYLPLEIIEKKIFIIRGQKVMLSPHLSELYGVEARVLIQTVKRNINRFPSDFMFQLTKKEYEDLKSQFVISSWGGARRANPYAFNEQGVAMLSSVLRSERAVQVNIQIMRAFVKLREIISTHKELAQKLKELELKIESHDKNITAIFEAINQLIASEEKSKRKIGFDVKEKSYKYKARRK